MTTVVLDTSALLAYLRCEPGKDRIDQILTGSDYVCAMHAANVIELYYKTAEKSGPLDAEKLFQGFGEFGITVYECMNTAFQLRCGVLKTIFPSLSLADTMVVALAEMLNGTVLTSDKEFDRVAELVRVEQFR